MTIEAKIKETSASRIRLGMVAGALSSSPERAQASGRELGLAEDRIYSSCKDAGHS